MTTYYFAMASKRFLIEEEPVEEILRERLMFYQANNKSIDFWLIQNPNFFDQFHLFPPRFSDTNLAAIISTNKIFINWLRLRLQYVTTGTIEINSPQMLEDMIENHQ